MTLVRQHEQIEILVRLDQRVNHQQRIVRRHVGIHRTVREEQVSLQVLRVRLVRLIVVVAGAVGLFLQQPLPLFAPIVFVLPVVVIAGLRNPDLEEIRIAEHRVGGRIAAARVAIDAGAIDVDPRVPLRELFHPGNLIGERVVAHIGEIRFVKFFRTPRRPHPVDLDDDEAEFGKRLRIAAGRVERAPADAAGLRPGIDVVDERILLRWIEHRRLEHQPIEVRLAVARFDGNRRRRLPSGREQL